MRAVFLGLLRHQADVRNRAHGLGIERAVGLAVVDDRLIEPRVGAVRDRGDDVVQLAVGAPHAAEFADHRRHRRVDDHVAGYVQARDALVGIDHGEARPFRVLGRDVVLDRFFLGLRQRLDLRQQIAEAVVEIDAELLERGGVLLDHIGEEHGNGVAENDGIGDLHHGRLDVQREQHAFLLGGVDLLGKERAQRLAAHDRRIDDLAGLNRRLRLQHRDGAVGADQLDADVGRRRDGGRDFRAVVIAARHVGHMRFGVRAPGAHLVRIVAGVLLDGAGGAAVGIAFAQDRIDDAAKHLAVAGLDVLLGVVRRVVRIVRNVVALALQFLDRGLELRDRGGDVRKLDDVGFGLHRELAELGEFVVNPLRRGELLGETGEDAAGQRDILQFHGHARRAHEGFDDRQQGESRERGGFIDLRPHDFAIWHVCTSGRRVGLARPEN